MANLESINRPSIPNRYGLTKPSRPPPPPPIEDRQVLNQNPIPRSHFYNHHHQTIPPHQFQHYSQQRYQHQHSHSFSDAHTMKRYNTQHFPSRNSKSNLHPSQNDHHHKFTHNFNHQFLTTQQRNKRNDYIKISDCQSVASNYLDPSPTTLLNHTNRSSSSTSHTTKGIEYNTVDFEKTDALEKCKGDRRERGKSTLA